MRDNIYVSLFVDKDGHLLISSSVLDIEVRVRILKLAFESEDTNRLKMAPISSMDELIMSNTRYINLVITEDRHLLMESNIPDVYARLQILELAYEVENNNLMYMLVAPPSNLYF